AGQVGQGTIILNAPAGFIFDTGGTAPTVSRSGKNLLLQGIVTGVTPTQITYTVTATSGSPTRLTWQNVRVRPTSGTPLAGGYLTCGGTASVAGLPANTHLGSLREIAGAASGLAFTTQPGNAAVGSVFGSQPVVRTEDQFGNASTAGLGANRNLSLSLTGGTGPLQGTASFDVGTDAGNGTATFTDLRID